MFLKFDLMKKQFAILFLFLYVFSTTELSQLLKLPILIEHYFEHKEKSYDLSFSDFLVLHYNEDHFKGHAHDEDYDQDKRLPFMLHSSTLSFVFISLTSINLEVIDKAYIEKEKTFPFENEFLINHIYLSSIWQPPKAC